MELKLIFVDSAVQTRAGFVRGIISFLLLGIFSFMYFVSTWSWYHDESTIEPTPQLAIGILFVLLLLCSALSVSHPVNAGVAATYGFLVGLVVIGSINATLFAVKSTGVFAACVDTLAGALIAALVSWILFLRGQGIKSK